MMKDRSVSRFPVADVSTLPEDLHDYVGKVAERTGFMPNVFRALIHRPEELRAFIGLHDALMLKDSPALSKADREMIVVATSAENDCLYCVVAHGAVLRIRRRDPRIADQIATNYRKADLTGRERAMLDFAVKVANDSAAVEEADIERLRAEGFTADDIWDIGSIAALFAYSNRMANFASMMPNEEFYGMGR
jgi:uncharacterized peroxidase-related enzyme